MEASKTEISLLELEYSQILEHVKNAEKEIRQLRKSNEILIRDQKVCRDKVKQLELGVVEAKARNDEQVSELESQVRDLTFFTRTTAQVAASPLKSELEGGSVVVGSNTRGSGSTHSTPQKPYKR